MATSASRKTICSLVYNGTLELKGEAGSEPNYYGVVVTEDTLLVIDRYECNLQVHSRHDGKLYTSHTLESPPMDVCLISKTEVAVCLEYSEIVILSFKSVDDVKRVKTLDFVHTEFDEYHSVAKWNSDKLVVSGTKYDGMMCWGVVSITDGDLHSTHDICDGYGSHLAIQDNTVYISCWTGDSITRGVYAYDILNPHTHKFLYQHKELKLPGSIMADRDCVYVTDKYSNRIHQLTDSGQLVTIHTVSSSPNGIFYDDQHGVLYTTSYRSNLITVYKMEYSHKTGVPVEIQNMDDRSIQLFEDALKDGKETIYSIRIMVVGHMGVGKTTLVKRLLGEEVNISERRSTEGIDVYVNCCDVSLSTCEWTRRERDSEQDYKLQRFVKVLNENYKTSENTADQEQVASSPQQERADQNPIGIVADDDRGTEVIYHRAPQQNIGQNLSSTARLQEESPSTVDQSNRTQSENNLMHGREPGESNAPESHKTDPLREMLKLLKENPDKAKQDVRKYARLSVWDFAGQYAFYTTHQMFLTRRAIYLLVSDVSGQITDNVEDECYFDTEGRVKCKVYELAEVWLNSVHSCAPPDTENMYSAHSPTTSFAVIPPPVILVGTHVDQISQELGLKYLTEIRSYLRDKPTIVHLVDKDFAIDNTVVDSQLEELKWKIIDVASQQPYWGEEIPTRWFLLEQQLMKLRDAGMKMISRSTVEELNKEGAVQIKESEELDLFLKYLHETGTIIYFNIEVLRENIILDPKWLIDALKLLINAHPNLPESPADNGSQSNSPADNGSQPHIPTNSDAGSGSQTNSPADIAIRQKWSDFKDKGILTPELVDAIWTKEKHSQLHTNKDHMLLILEQFNIISKPRSFSEIGEKVENYFLAPCMLRQESPGEVISLEQDPHMVSTPVLCCVFRGKYLPPPIFHRLIAACVTHWPVAKKKETSEYLIFCGCCIFDIDLFHRLTLHCRSHIVYARIARMVIDEVRTLDAKLCTRVRKFITLNLSKITSYLGQNLQYELRIQSPLSQCVSQDGRSYLSPAFEMWFADEGHDPDTPITPEHMNHARLCVALVTVCGKAMRDILLTYFPVPYKDIYQVILANRANLTRRQGRPLLNSDQVQLVFPDPQGQTTGTVDQFDLSLLYTLIRNVSTVPAPKTGWGNDPQDQPRDSTLGASVERIRSYRNHISGHSPDGKISRQDLEDYWNKFEAVIHDIETVINRQVYSQELEKQRKQVISIYEAC